MTAQEDFFQPWETVAQDFDGVVSFINEIRDRWLDKGHQFAWRGVVNAEWALDSSLHRRLGWTKGGAKYPAEADLNKAEKRILVDAHRWGLHWSSTGRLPILMQLALLQHYGSPTRLIDVTFNAWIGVFFAVEEKRSNTELQNEAQDGRLFAIDVSNYIINEDNDRRSWADALSRPWPSPATPLDDPQKEWMTSVFAWRPPHTDPRIAAQNGGFIFGGVPSIYAPGNKRKWWKRDATAGSANIPIDEVRRCTSIAVRPHKVAPVRGALPTNPMFTLRIAAAAKPEIRKRLKELFGYEHRTIYPDISGFAAFGVQHLKSWP
jgi:hypothetical protein